ncbi:hypothetical protein GGF43_002564 [Coemansia sp. RSA 2618]|nr:hypothetical protein GGF43_002564 [Coemansia sp. RSA 2618]
MHSVEAKSSPGLVAYMILAVVSVWSWVATVPRAVGEILAYLLDLFESLMLSILWEYQGENILKFLYKHRNLAHNPVGTSTRTKHRSQAMQTDSAAYKEYEEKQQQQARRSAVIDKLVEDLVPELLGALYAMPQKSEIDGLLGKHIGGLQGASTQQLQALAQLQQTFNAHGIAIGSAVQGLDARANAVDEQLVHTSSALEAVRDTASGIDNRVAELVGEFSAAKVKYAANAAALEQLSQSIARLDTMIAENSARDHAANKHNVAVATEHMSESRAAPKALHIVESATTIRTTNEASNIARSAPLATECQVEPKTANNSPTAASGSRDSDDGHSDTTVERIYAIDALKELEPTTAPEPDMHSYSQTASIKSHRFSLRREFKRRSLFGKRPE